MSLSQALNQFAQNLGRYLHFLFASLLRILYFTCAKRWNSAKILFAWYLLGWVAKRGCGTILSGGALWRRAFLANRGKETGP